MLEEKSLGLVAEDTKKSFESFDICHHCKQLYDTLYLTKCNYHSSTMGPPTHNLSFMDPYIQFIVQRSFYLIQNRHPPQPGSSTTIRRTLSCITTKKAANSCATVGTAGSA